MLYRHVVDGCFGDRLDRASFEGLRQQAAEVAARLVAEPNVDERPILSVAGRQQDLAEIGTLAARFRALCREVLVLGIGGSSLGGQTLVALADRGFGPAAGAPVLRFLDNVDPDTLDLVQESLDPETAGLIIVSKSGTTVETLAQALALLPPYLKLSPERRAERVLAMTEEPDSVLGRLARQHGLGQLPHEGGLGGRFTALSAVGLLPAAIAGVDIAAVRRGAQNALEALQAGTSPAIEGAALMAGLMQAGASQQILMPYADRLARFGLWFVQLWAESLGKEGKGQTPVRAVGTVDQHSQLQLYLDGPRDKAFTLLRLETQGQGALLDPALVGGPGLEYLEGRTLGDLIDAEARATRDSLLAKGLPCREFVLPRLDETVLGALLLHFMLETILTAELLGISAFGQPAVEDGKRRARQYLAEMGA